ncbi:MAG: PQQ-dependent sugar dehydrogenase [Pseudomonadota bacterium]
MRTRLLAGIVAAGSGLALLAGLGLPGGGSGRAATSAGTIVVERLADDLDLPWAVAPLPDGGALITEKDGRLWYFDAAFERKAIGGVPEVFNRSQGGLLDVAPARDFAETGEIFLTYAEPAGGSRARTAMAIAALDTEAGRLRDVRVIFRQEPSLGGGRHFGSRIAEAADGTIFITTGDRGERPLAQDPDNHVGKVVRIARDGSVPSDNPFPDGRLASGGAIKPEIWSLGHRNPQGSALDESGRLWTLSHGARGGDEVNLSEAGLNYGWPVISYGRHYAGGQIGEGTARVGMEQPRFYWDPSMAPSGMIVYGTASSGAAFADWRGDLIVGSLKFSYVGRLDREGGEILGEERLFEGVYGRVRDIAEAPDSSIWFLSVNDGALYRMAPEGWSPGG